MFVNLKSNQNGRNAKSAIFEKRFSAAAAAAAAAWCQGCQMVCFQTKNQNLGKFWRAMK
jgi:hypothetical protein